MESVPSVLDQCLRLTPEVSVRPERFGALLYHFGTRRLAFLKSRLLFDVVSRLEQPALGRAACAAAGVPEADLSAYERALRRLLDTDMLQMVEAHS